ncbi:hypothetical protein [Fictibacillus phosphorivorans]|uniref:hypothetical protein n=1 Tax=Fictibacillus phosphorivorans TaxID=1221500 RepID=UPI0035E8B321
MTQIFVLLVSTLIVGSLLYFYPPNVKRPLKMTILGLAFLLALGGLFILNNLSFGLTLTAMMSIAFIASYIVAKKFNLVSASTGQSDIVFSFSQNEIAAEKYVQENLIEHEHAVAIEEPIMSSNNFDSEIQVSQEDLMIKAVQELQDLDPIELLDIDLDEIILEEEKNVDIDSSAQDSEQAHELGELTDEEFKFLTETREISDEEVTNVSVPTDIEDKILSQRVALLEELDEIEVVEELPLLEEEIDSEEELSHDKDFVVKDNELDDDSIAEESLEKEEDGELLITIHEETNTEVAHIMEEPIIDAEITLEEPIRVESEIEKPLEKLPETVESVEEIESFEVQDEFLVLDTEEEVVAEIEEVEAYISESVEISTPDMNVELQDMFLSTLRSYEETGDHSSYQEMIVTLLHQKLSDKDFYLFSKLLLDSYVTSSDLSNVNPLIEKMEEKLSHYSVIVEELQRYKEMNK